MNPRFIFVIFLFLISLSVNAQLFNEQGLKFMRIFDWINNRYVDSVNIDKFSDSLIKDALHKLDPHSAYLTKEEVEELNEPLKEILME
jgi:carboxyl-terminal processing protease